MKRYVILISGRGSNMESLLDAGLPGVCAAVISNRPEAAGLALAAARGIATVCRRPSRLRHARGLRCRAGDRDRAARAGPGPARRLHAHPRRSVRAPLRRTPAEHPSLPAAGLSGRQDPRPGAGRRGAGARLQRAFRHARRSTAGRSSPRPRYRCRPATTRPALPPACWPRNMRFIRASHAGSSKVGWLCATAAPASPARRR
jgi:hypothetical protein